MAMQHIRDFMTVFTKGHGEALNIYHLCTITRKVISQSITLICTKTISLRATLDSQARAEDRGLCIWNLYIDTMDVQRK